MMQSSERIREELSDLLSQASPAWKKSIAILLPCFNTEHTAAQVIAGFRKPLPRAAGDVSDDNSSDRTAEIAPAAGAVPHRLFPIEHHTAVPFLDFTDAGFRLACHVLGKTDWAREENLILMTPARLAQAVPAARAAKIGRTGLPLAPFSSNLYLQLA